MTISATAFAYGPMEGRGKGGSGCCQNGSVNKEQFKKFQADTIDLRQEMMNKRFEQQRENLKGTPDAAKIAALQADISAIRTKIQSLRAQSGLPDRGMRDGEVCNPGSRGNGKRCFGM